jgi:DNA-3-methyladenine glycosylase I
VPRVQQSRCWWCVGDELYEQYHDTEWGVPVRDDLKLFELLLLESFQAGLSWITILRKRESFRKAFWQFDPERIARMRERDIESLLLNPGIVRHRKKIEAARANARAFLDIQKTSGSFSTYIWNFTDGKTLLPSEPITPRTIRATTPESVAMSKELKKRGFSFVGPSICYAFMQAAGLVNDHADACFLSPRRKKK